MATTLLKTLSDLTWLKDVHLKNCLYPPFKLAILDGNEDWPTSITLFERNHFQSRRLVLTPDADGKFTCNQTEWEE